MITKKILPLYAILAVFVIVAVPYTAAAGEDLVEKRIMFEIKSEHADLYDDVVNVADESAITNPDTWMPSPQGIWLGASTEESLYEFDKIMEANNVFQVHSHHRFNSTQIMNGASVTVIRSPIAPDGVQSMRLRVWMLDSPEWEIRDDLTEFPFIQSDDHMLAASVEIDMTDGSITGGGDQWTVDGRTYIVLYGPLYSEVDYVFSWAAKYEPDNRPKMYLASQDICNDEIMDTQVGIRSKVGDQTYKKIHKWEIDPGISFDFQQGLGSGVYAQSWYMESGDSISFITRSDKVGDAWDYYHTLMIPWVTSSGRLDAEVIVERQVGSEWSTLWEDSRIWNGYILACSDTKINNVLLPELRVTVTLRESARVSWIFIDSASRLFGQTLRYNHAIIDDGAEHKIQSRLYASYQKSVEKVYPPSLDPADFPALPEPQVNERGNYYGTIIGSIMILVGGAMVATGVLAPVGFLVGGAGAVMLASDLMSGGNFFGGAGTSGINLPGIFSNPLDKIRDALVSTGKFLHSIGEALYDGIMWLVDSIDEYLPILLGLLIIGISLVLFFFPIYAQIKLWGIFLAFSEGDSDKAIAQAQDMAGAVSGAVSKLRRR